MRPSSRPQPDLGAAIRELRRKNGFTQDVLAATAGTSTRTLALIESGNANPTWATVRDIADALGVTVAELAKAAEKT